MGFKTLTILFGSRYLKNVNELLEFVNGETQIDETERIFFLTSFGQDMYGLAFISAYEMH